MQASTFIYVISLQDLFKFIYKKDSKKNVTSAHALMLQIILYIMLYQTMIYRITVPVSTQLPSIYCSIMLSAFKRLCVRQDVHWRNRLWIWKLAQQGHLRFWVHGVPRLTRAQWLQAKPP